MRSVEFNIERDYDSGPDVQVARVSVRLFPVQGLPLTLDALLDTGASFSIFDKAIADLLGIADVTTGAPRIVASANEAEGSATAYAYLHNVEIEFLGHRMTIPIGFVPTWDEGIDNLLGMLGFFDGLEIAFLHRERLILVNFL